MYFSLTNGMSYVSETLEVGHVIPSHFRLKFWGVTVSPVIITPQSVAGTRVLKFPKQVVSTQRRHSKKPLTRPLLALSKISKMSCVGYGKSTRCLPLLLDELFLNFL